MWAALDGPYVRQQRGMKAAHDRKLQVVPIIEADARFASVRLSVSTYPALVVTGTVRDEIAMQDLRSLVAIPTDANYQLSFQVRADSDAVIQQGQ